MRARLVAALATLVLLSGCTTAPPTRTDAAPTGSSAGAEPHDAGNPDEDGPGAAVSAPAADAALLHAQTFVAAWARPDRKPGAWFTGIQKLVTAGYAHLLASTDPANVPARTVTGSPTAVSSTTAVLIADVPTDAGPIRVTVVQAGGRWLVATVVPAPTPVVPS